ncbi:unnamed protein product [Owenia fusiformis]|uniref:Uncharacterized protein n=1 Tax=Owenia fusiformis TaxID=6347 RepID=A0A8S4Q7Y5_OWEFU|nr:unnamed protein product [Owenia fusiformis]
MPSLIKNYFSQPLHLRISYPPGLLQYSLASILSTPTPSTSNSPTQHEEVCICGRSSEGLVALLSTILTNCNEEEERMMPSFGSCFIAFQVLNDISTGDPLDYAGYQNGSFW